MLGVCLWISWVIVCFLLDEYKSKVACEDDKLRLSCKKSMVIAIYSAIFGRTQGGSLECPYQNLGMPMIGKRGMALQRILIWESEQVNLIYCHCIVLAEILVRKGRTGTCNLAHLVPQMCGTFLVSGELCHKCLTEVHVEAIAKLWSCRLLADSSDYRLQDTPWISYSIVCLPGSPYPLSIPWRCVLLVGVVDCLWLSQALTLYLKVY